MVAPRESNAKNLAMFSTDILQMPSRRRRNTSFHATTNAPQWLSSGTSATKDIIMGLPEVDTGDRSFVPIYDFSAAQFNGKRAREERHNFMKHSSLATTANQSWKSVNQDDYIKFPVRRPVKPPDKTNLKLQGDMLPYPTRHFGNPSSALSLSQANPVGSSGLSGSKSNSGNYQRTLVTSHK